MVARDMLDKTTKWLKNRLQLEVSKEKQKTVNSKKNSMDFLCCSIKAKIENNKPKIVSHIEKDRLKKSEEKIKKQIRIIKKHKTSKYGKGKTLPYIREKPIIPIGNIEYNAKHLIYYQ